jgi:hypothetical protein
MEAYNPVEQSISRFSLYLLRQMLSYFSIVSPLSSSLYVAGSQPLGDPL